MTILLEVENVIQGLYDGLHTHWKLEQREGVEAARSYRPGIKPASAAGDLKPLYTVRLLTTVSYLAPLVNR